VTAPIFSSAAAAPAFDVHRGPGSGEVLVFKTGAPTASGTFARVIRSLAAYFDAEPEVSGGLIDREDRRIEAALLRKKSGQTFFALAFVRPGSAAVVCDRAEDFRRHYPELRQVLARAVPEEIRWTRVHSDRLGTSAELPEGWRITGGERGGMAAEGPQGWIDLGTAVTVTSPELAMMTPFRPPLVAAWGDPAAALLELLPQIGAVAGERWTPVRLHDRTEVPYENGRGALADLEWTKNGAGVRTLVLVLARPFPDGAWMMYSSWAGSAAAAFEENLPILWRIWQSWHVDPQVHWERIRKAQESLKEVTRIIREVTRRRQEAFDRSMQSWESASSPQEFFIDEHTGQVYKTGSMQLDRMVEERNRQEGRARYRRLSPEEAKNWR
jgi:hypothetical protein